LIFVKSGYINDIDIFKGITGIEKSVICRDDDVTDVQGMTGGLPCLQSPGLFHQRL
jgi:hypothetical protein